MFKCSLIGNLGKDAEIISTTKGRSFVTFPVAHTRNFTKDGVRQSETIWIEVNVNYDITNTLPYLLKGTKVFIYGELVPKIYTSAKGAILNLKMFCDDLELCGVKPIKGDADAPLDIRNNNEVF